MLDMDMVYEYFLEHEKEELYGQTLAKVERDTYEGNYNGSDLYISSFDVVTLYFELEINGKIFENKVGIETQDSVYFNGTSVTYVIKNKCYSDDVSGVKDLEKSIKIALNHINPNKMKLDWR